MTEWFERAYEGGGPVKLDGFARPLYSPDAAQYGKKASVDGPDVKALKRALCRGGRWGTWDPDSWDDSFSNAFSHGRGPNVKDTGCAGFQRQMDLDPTGWWGSKSYNTLRYCLISDPSSPHYGEPLLDGVCVQLLNEAFAMFGGHEPDDQGSTLRKKALERARGEIGYVEGANNANKYGAWYGMDHQPYCAMFVTWAFENAGDSPTFVRGSRYSYVPFLVSDARAGKYGLKVVGADEVTTADLCCFDFQWDGEYDHVGFFDKWNGANFDTVEANTSPQNSSGSQSNGGGVYARTRSLSSQATTFVRVAEP